MKPEKQSSSFSERLNSLLVDSDISVYIKRELKIWSNTGELRDDFFQTLTQEERSQVLRLLDPFEFDIPIGLVSIKNSYLCLLTQARNLSNKVNEVLDNNDVSTFDSLVQEQEKVLHRAMNETFVLIHQALSVKIKL